MGARDRCCCLGCPIFDDDFDPPCSGSLNSSLWDVVNGTITVIDPGADSCATSQQYASVPAGAIAIGKTPSVAYRHIANFAFNCVANSRPRIIVNAEYDPETGTLGDYYYVEIRPELDTIVFGYANGLGAGTELEEFTATCQTGVQFSAFINAYDTISAGYEDQCIWDDVGGFACSLLNADGRYCGFSNAETAGATAQIVGDPGFHFEEHEDSVPTCSYCDCLCDVYCVPPTLYGTLTILEGSSPCCAPNDVFPFTLEFNRGQDRCEWMSDYVYDNCGFEHIFEFWKDQGIRFGDAADWDLDDGGALVPSGSKLSGSCDPFYHVWQFEISDGVDTCLYTVEISDTA